MSLRAKLILSFSAVVIFTCALALILSFERMRAAFKDELRGNLMDLAQVVAFQVDGDLVAGIQSEADEQRPEYRQQRERLIAVKNKLPQVRFLYVYRPSTEAGKVQMIVGGEPFEWDQDEEHKADVTHFAPGDYSTEEYPRMHEAFEQPSADDDLSFDEEFKLWSLSGYAPVFDKAGKKVAAVGLDYPATGLKEKEQALLRLLLFSSAAALLVALLAGYVLAGLISKPLRALVAATDVIAGGDLKAQVDIERKDEIGALAKSFNKMVRNLREMATALQGYTTQAVESKELEVAARLQRSLVPTRSLKGPGVEAASVLRPVAFGGGTMFDYFLFGQNAYMMFSMGKVNAMGLEATSLITVCKSGLSALVSNLVFRPQEVLSRLSGSVAEARTTDSVMGFLCAVYDIEQGWLTVANAGHAYPYLLRPSTLSVIQIDQDSGPPLGGTPEAQYQDFDIKMEPGDCLVAFAPYVVELPNAKGEPFGLGRLEDTLRRHASLPPEALKDAVLAEVLAYHGADAPLDDDLAIVVLRFGDVMA